jgi:dTDP-4-amino-4,6-dideoxygalactose transaminase
MGRLNFQKVSPNDLAAFGGRPTFDIQLHVGRPNLGNRLRLLERFNNLLDSRWLTNDGPYLDEFEHRIAELLGAKHCMAVCNATVGLEILIRATGLAGEVIVPSFTFIATAHALKLQGITPVFCDISPRTHTIDPTLLNDLITPRTSGIIGVHLWGRPCQVDTLAEVATRHNLKLLFDAAHAFGCSHRGRMIGNFGDAEVFSFHATKFVNTFEGGVIATNDDDLASRIRLMRNFGFTAYDTVSSIGTNGKMSEVSAAMGLTSIESLDEFVEANRRNYLEYQRQLENIPGVSLVVYDDQERCNYQYIVLEIDEEVTQVGRDELLQVLQAENVLARRYFYPGCHRMEPYCSLSPEAGRRLYHTEQVAERVLSLPTGTTVEANDVRMICGILRLAIRHGREVRRRLLGGVTLETI